jgi:hypothetical protein
MNVISLLLQQCWHSYTHAWKPLQALLCMYENAGTDAKSKGVELSCSSDNSGLLVKSDG